MTPGIALDPETLAKNARAWAVFAGVPLRAVVKADAYGWGFGAVVPALEKEVAAFCVSDADELRALRRHTQLPAVLTGPVESARLPEVLDLDAVPSIATPQELAIAQEWARGKRALRLRVAVRQAAGWSGLSLPELSAFSAALARSRVEIELWAHLTDLAAIDEQQELFREAAQLLSAAGVNVIATETASTLSLAAGASSGDSVRIGAGLFGATGGSKVEGVACALHVSAPIVRVEQHTAGTRIGYGSTMLGMDEAIAIGRCGYSDGMPASAAGDRFFFVGMQYLAARAQPGSESAIVILDRDSDLDAFARSAGRPVHEIITAFGNAARAAAVDRERDAST